MFVDYSEISVSVIVKHVHNFEIIRTFCLTGETCSVFLCMGKSCGLLGGISTQADPMAYQSCILCF